MPTAGNLLIVIVRHGEKAYAPAPESEWPLSSDGVDITVKFAQKLIDQQLRPDVILSSRWRHAMQTAEIIAAKAGVPVIPITGLTPGTPEAAFAPLPIFREALESGVPLGGVRTVLLVGHHARVSNLAGILCGTPPLRELGKVEGARLEAPSLCDLLTCRALFVDFIRA